MTKSLELIEAAFEEFRSDVEHCRNDATTAEIRRAYDSFYRLHQRYIHEDKAGTLSPIEAAALCNVFRKNRFIESVGEVREISVHVRKRKDVELLDADNVRFTLTPKSSARAVFAAPCVSLIDKQGEIQRINHLRWLTKAVDLIARAIAKARGA